MLSTPRLVLREFAAEDAPELFALYNDPDVMRYTGEEPFPSVPAVRAFIESRGGTPDRPEVRWDWFVGEGRPFDSRDGGMTGTEVSQFTGSLDIVARF